MSETAAKKDVQKLQRTIVDALEDIKGQDIRVFNTEHLSPLFERVIVASGTSNRQTKALAASVRDKLRNAGYSKPRIEGEDNGEWVIVDCGQVVVHVMQPAIRQYYHLEELWGDKPVRLKGPEARAAGAQRKVEAMAEEEPAPARAKRAPAATKKAAASAAGARSAAPKAAAQKAPAKKAAAKKAPARTAAAKAPARKPAGAAAKPVARKTSAAPRTARTADLPKVVVNKPKAAAKTGTKPAVKPAAKSAPKAAPKAATKAPSRPAAKAPAKKAPAKKASPSRTGR